MSKITLVSSQNDEILIAREAAMISPTLKAMLESPLKEASGVIELLNMDTNLLKKVAEYLEYNLQYKSTDEDQEDVPEFEIPTEMALELLLAADYLNV